LIVPDFLVDSVGDEVLHPAGSLATELLTIASQDNISDYVSSKAGSSSLFPTSPFAHHSTETAPFDLPSPPPSPLILKTASSSESSSRHLLGLLTTGPSQKTTNGSTSTVVAVTKPGSCGKSVASSVCELFHENPHFNLRDIYSRLSQAARSFPHTSSSSEPTTLFILCPHHSELCFLTQQGPAPSDYSLEFLFVDVHKQAQWTDYLSSLGGVTVIEGILSFDHQRRNRTYLCQDIALMNGIPLLLSAKHSLSHRQELLGVWLFDSPFDENILESSIEFILERHDG
jgi:hypothetical protein